MTIKPKDNCKEKKKSRSTIEHKILAGLIIDNRWNYLNVLVMGCRKRPGRSMVEQLLNKQSVLAGLSGFNSQPRRLQFLGGMK